MWPADAMAFSRPSEAREKGPGDEDVKDKLITFDILFVPEGFHPSR